MEILNEKHKHAICSVLLMFKLRLIHDTNMLWMLVENLIDELFKFPLMKNKKRFHKQKMQLQSLHIETLLCFSIESILCQLFSKWICMYGQNSKPKFNEKCKFYMLFLIKNYFNFKNTLFTYIKRIKFILLYWILDKKKRPPR